MTTDTIQRLEQELLAAYSAAVLATDGSRRLIRLPEVHCPEGCNPATVEALVLLDANAAKPELYLREVPTLTSGVRPNIGTVTVAGSTWQTFSFNLLWDENTHTAIQFLEGKLARFRRAS
jgi:hypothetical protein